jgi:transcriptional regulator with XRE-family HTH domain
MIVIYISVNFIRLKMKIQVNLPIPALKALHKVGKDISNARRRRRITIQLMAERAGVSRGTIGKIEKGDPTTSIGGYSAVLFVLGMIDRLSNLVDAVYDLTGRQLIDEKLPQRVRLRRPKKKNNNHE